MPKVELLTLFLLSLRLARSTASGTSSRSGRRRLVEVKVRAYHALRAMTGNRGWGRSAGSA
eukprot:5990417-Prorocentrum_lima.AAC.1